MPNLQETPLAILCSDLHLRETTPRSRAESDWYEVMAAQLAALTDAAREFYVPIICAGDVFDKWNPSAELVNFAIDNLPTIYAIPGQHDLRYHAYDERYRGAYGALCKTRKIIDLPANQWFLIHGGHNHLFNLWTWAMPWGKYGVPDPIQTSSDFKLGVLHQYRWCNTGNKHAMADDSSKLESLIPGLDALLIGDNHIPWELPRVLNHGGFIPQNSDQRDYVPHYGVLFADGHIERKPYNVPEPQWVENEVPQQAEASGVIEQLNNLQETSDSFTDRLKRAVQNEVRKTVKEELEAILQKVIG